MNARLDTDTAKMLIQYCSAHRCNTSVALRSAIRALGVANPEAQLADLCKLLGLPPDADPSAVLDAVGALLNAGSPPDPTAETADAPPKALTKAEQAYCAREKITPAQFRTRVADSVKRAPNRPAPRKASR